MWRIVMMAILCMQLVACSAATGSSGKVESTPSSTATIAKVTPINAAVEKCNLTTADFVDVVDDGYSIRLLRRNNNKASISGLKCVMQELGIPTYIRYLMYSTFDIDGIQREENDAYKIYWTAYSDDAKSIEVIIHMK